MTHARSISFPSWLAAAGQAVVFLRMLDSPGNYLAIMRRTTPSLRLPCTYTGRVLSAAKTYQHATLTWESQPHVSDTSEELWLSAAKRLMEVELSPLQL